MSNQKTQFNIALSDWQVAEIERQAKLLGIKRTELVVRWVSAHLQEPNVKPVFTEAQPTQKAEQTKLSEWEDDDLEGLLSDLPRT